MAGPDRTSQAEPLGRDPAGGEADELTAAELTEVRLAEQLDDLTRARSRAEAEARRLAARAAAAPADLALAELVRRYENQSAVLTSEIAVLRATLRGAEARTARMRAGPGG